MQVFIDIESNADKGRVAFGIEDVHSVGAMMTSVSAAGVALQERGTS